MNTPLLPVSNRRLSQALLAAVATCAGGAACADEPSPYYIGLIETVARDSNVFRIPGGPSDTYFSTGLLGGFDQTISRQRLFAEGNVAYNKYRGDDQPGQPKLDNTSYGLKAGWDWATIDKLSGTLGANANQSLATESTNTGVTISDRNLLKTDQISATARLGGEGILSLDGGYAHSRVSYSAIEYLYAQSSGDTASLGGRYRLGPTVTVGLGYRYTRTYSPYAILINAVTVGQPGPSDYAANTTNGRNGDLTVDWVASDKTRVNARLSYTRQTNSLATAQNFSGPTGSVAGYWSPTGKITLNASFARDAGAYAAFFNVAGATPGTTILGQATTTQVANTYDLGVAYRATAKITLKGDVQASLQHQTSAQAGAAAAGSLNDDTHSASLAATYDVARNWQLGCSVVHLNRNVSGSVNFEYSSNTVGCSAQVKFQ